MLFTKKLKVEMVICQEELKILRLQWGLMFEHALGTLEKQLVAAIEHKKQLKVYMGAYRVLYTIYLLPHYIDVLHLQNLS